MPSRRCGLQNQVLRILIACVPLDETAGYAKGAPPRLEEIVRGKMKGASMGRGENSWATVCK